MSNNKNPHAVALGRLGGKRTSEKKAEAVRKNGAKGGRPKKSAQEREDEATEKMLKRLKVKNEGVKLSRSLLD